MVPLGMFFDPEFRGFSDASITQARFKGEETLDEVSYRVLEFTGIKPYEFTLKCYAAHGRTRHPHDAQAQAGSQDAHVRHGLIKCQGK